ncbi:3-oxoacyl-(acyl-carrier-protein) synthase III [Thermovirga lienii DSM 17291]|uniref:Beta-ketoacyl-[acyl-carrier-protein] synthase III n=1 Tax=Thermovirga lienii (strain ATCC BAA-1197 / DSM 17291 / Cas60314) TaxID=580340 RepID=G7VAD7_THELD|nr:3-oxoacyl-(acyl-carrier-protein) synthase III [Thermovirga lienii DSM 17291]
MSSALKMPIKILGTGKYVPSKVLTNLELEKIVDTTDEWITTRTGIKERRISEGELTSDLAYKAALEAIKDAGISAEEIDMIIVATNSPDTLFPGVAPKVQALLGARHAGACDVQSGCTGCVYALSMAFAGVGSGMWKNVLVIGAEVLSKLIDWTDRNTCVLFGDGAGAVVVSGGEGGGCLLASELRADGSKADLIKLPGGLVEKPASHETVDNREHFVQMKGNEVFKFVNRVLPSFLDEVCDKANLTPEDIDWWIFHQANMRIIEGVLRRSKQPHEKAIINLDKYGNTSAASVFIAFHDALKDGRIKKGDTILMTSFGAGMTYGAVIFSL